MRFGSPALVPGFAPECVEAPGRARRTAGNVRLHAEARPRPDEADRLLAEICGELGSFTNDLKKGENPSDPCIGSA